MLLNVLCVGAGDVEAVLEMECVLYMPPNHCILTSVWLNTLESLDIIPMCRSIRMHRLLHSLPSFPSPPKCFNFFSYNS